MSLAIRLTGNEKHASKVIERGTVTVRSVNVHRDVGRDLRRDGIPESAGEAWRFSVNHHGTTNDVPSCTLMMNTARLGPSGDGTLAIEKGCASRGNAEIVGITRYLFTISLTDH